MKRDADDTIVLVKKKIALLHQYLGITKRISESIRAGKGDDLTGFLSKRREFIDLIRGLDRRIQAARVSHGALRKRGSSGDPERMLALLETIHRLDGEIMATVGREVDVTRRQLHAIRSGRKAAGGYRPAAGRRTGCIHRTG